jgi:hypothetical protein
LSTLLRGRQSLSTIAQALATENEQGSSDFNPKADKFGDISRLWAIEMVAGLE